MWDYSRYSIQHTAVLCALIVEHQPLSCSQGNLTSGAWQYSHPHTHSHSIAFRNIRMLSLLQLFLQLILVGENHDMKYVSVFPPQPRCCCVGSIGRLLIKWARSGFGAFLLWSFRALEVNLGPIISFVVAPSPSPSPAWFPLTNDTTITQFYGSFYWHFDKKLPWLGSNKSIEIFGFESFSSLRWLLHWRMVNIKPTMPLCSPKEKSSKIFVSLIYVENSFQSKHEPLKMFSVLCEEILESGRDDKSLMRKYSSSNVGSGIHKVASKNIPTH